LFLIKRRESLMEPLSLSLAEAARAVKPCSICGNLDTIDPCALCNDPARDAALICVVEDVADLWAMERAHIFKGRYHVLGGTLSALDGIGPGELRIDSLVARVADVPVREVILALNATVEGQTTAHYIIDRLEGSTTQVTRLAHGVPVGGELDYLDEGTLAAALLARTSMKSGA
jgi:recombination protein RecR